VFPKEDASLLTLKLSIQKCGYTYKHCTNIDDACKQFVNENYDIIIIDTRNKFTQLNGTANEFNYEKICR
jgi:DNA-binding response OmpR family regulator